MRTRCLRSLLGMMILCVAFAVMGCGKGENKEPTPTPTVAVPDLNEPTKDPDDPDYEDPDASPTPTEYPKRADVTYGSDEKLYNMYEQAADLGAKYHVKIYIADLVPDEVLDFIRAERQMNSYRIFKALQAIDTTLKYYPENFFGSEDYLEKGDEYIFSIYLVSNSPNFEAAIMCFDYDEDGNGWEGMVMQGETQDDWDDYSWRFHFCLMYMFADLMDYYSLTEPEDTLFDAKTWMSLQPEGFKYLGEGVDGDQCAEHAAKYPGYFFYDWEVCDSNTDRCYIFADLMWCLQNTIVSERPEPYLRKMGYLIACLRDFHTRSDEWPELTSWESFYHKLCDVSGVKPGWE